MLGALRKQPPKLGKLEKWIVSKGDNPWDQGAFKGSDPLQTLKNIFTQVCKEKKLRGSKKDTYASWGLWIALKGSIETIQEGESREKELQELIAQLESRERELTQTLQNMEKEFSQKLESRGKELTDKLESTQKELEAAIREAEDRERRLIEENNQWTQRNLDLLIEQGSFIATVQESQEKEREATLKAESANRENEALREELAQTKYATNFFLDQAQQAQDEVTHKHCLEEINALKQQLGLQKAVIAAARPVANSLISLPSKTTYPEDARPSTPLNPDRRDEKEDLAPMRPVTTKTVTKPNADGSGTTGLTIKERVAWKPKEVKAIAEQLGPLNRETGVKWMTMVSNLYPMAEGADLTQLARACTSGADSVAIDIGIMARDLNTKNQLSWMREIIQLLWPDKSSDYVYYTEEQAPGEDPEAYVSRKKLLAILADRVAIDAGIPNYDNDNFKRTLYNGFNLQTQIILSRDINPTKVTWGKMSRVISQIGDLFRMGAFENFFGPPLKTVESIQPVKCAKYSPHSQYRSRDNCSSQPHKRWSNCNSQSRGNAGNGGEQSWNVSQNGYVSNSYPKPESPLKEIRSFQAPYLGNSGEGLPESSQLQPGVFNKPVPNCWRSKVKPGIGSTVQERPTSQASQTHPNPKAPKPAGHGKDSYEAKNIPLRGMERIQRIIQTQNQVKSLTDINKTLKSELASRENKIKELISLSQKQDLETKHLYKKNQELQQKLETVIMNKKQSQSEFGKLNIQLERNKMETATLKTQLQNVMESHKTIEVRLRALEESNFKRNMEVNALKYCKSQIEPPASEAVVKGTVLDSKAPTTSLLPAASERNPVHSVKPPDEFSSHPLLRWKTWLDQNSDPSQSLTIKIDINCKVEHSWADNVPRYVKTMPESLLSQQQYIWESYPLFVQWEIRKANLQTAPS